MNIISMPLLSCFRSLKLILGIIAFCGNFTGLRAGEATVSPCCDKSYKNKILKIAENFQGIPYKGGTLDVSVNEGLVARTDSFDCTTFVETVLALYLASCADNHDVCISSKETIVQDSRVQYSSVQDTSHDEDIRCDISKIISSRDYENNDSFRKFCDALQIVRYRDGIIDGYPSRLHYFSDWISDNEKKGIVKEVTSLTSGCEYRTFDLDFMTTHYSSYPVLKSDTSMISEIRNIEKEWKSFRMNYIPKSRLSDNKANSDTDSTGIRRGLVVDNGDIIALTTRIDGLDIVHVGFAKWIDGRLHLVHASSQKGEVIVDDVSLYDYLKNKKNHTGIRVVEICEPKCYVAE